MSNKILSYPTMIVSEAGEHTDKAFRAQVDQINVLQAQLDASQLALDTARKQIPSLAQIQKALQLGGSNTINITGVPGIPGQIIPSATVGSHTQRTLTAVTVGTFFVENDRGYLYAGEVSAGINVWQYLSGISYGLFSARWTDLGANDNGALFVATDRMYCYEWVNPLWRYRWGVATDTHANRYALLSTQDTGSLYFESDRNYLYEWDGTNWNWRSGVYVDVVANRPADLGTHDKGGLFYANDNFTMYEWDGTQWVTVGGAIWQAIANSITAAQWKDQAGTTVIDLDTTHKRVGINNSSPLVECDVTGEIRASVGYRQAGSEGNAGWVLRANGADFVGAQLAAVDLSNTVTGAGAVVLATAPTVATPTVTGAAPTVAASQLGLGAVTAATATAGGGQAALATVLGYLIFNVAGTNVKVPYFSV